MKIVKIPRYAPYASMTKNMTTVSIQSSVRVNTTSATTISINVGITENNTSCQAWISATGIR
jgi:hypothetical protein